jgi:hypothetical protein
MPMVRNTVIPTEPGRRPALGCGCGGVGTDADEGERDEGGEEPGHRGGQQDAAPGQ